MCELKRTKDALFPSFPFDFFPCQHGSSAKNFLEVFLSMSRLLVVTVCGQSQSSSTSSIYAATQKVQRKMYCLSINQPIRSIN